MPWLLSLLIGIAAALSLFPWPVLAGTAPYWKYPRGIFGSAYSDMATSTAGYYAFVRDTWHWPLFETTGLGNVGTNVILTDSIPCVSLVGRLLYQATGRVVPLFGPWTGMCVVGQALAATGLVRSLGARGWMPAAAAAALAVSLPAFLGRWGHVSLFAQALVPLALTFYVRLQATPRPKPAWVIAQSLLLCVAGLMTFPYFFPMMAGLCVAAILQAATDNRLTRRATVFVLASLVAGLFAIMGVMGFWAFGTDFAATGFGYYSMNLLSPFIPLGGLKAGGLDIPADATGGQYEGSIYFGAGLLILTILCFRQLAATVAAGARRHIWLLLAVVAFSCWALSNRVYAGRLLLFSMPVPDALRHAFGVFRSTGRFAWIGLYLVTALAIVAMSRRRLGGPVLLLLAGLQWIEAEPVRREIRASVAGPTVPLLDRAAWEALLPTIDRLIVDPPHDCVQEGPHSLRRELASVELELMAAEAGVWTNTVYAGRVTRDCSIPPATARSVVVYLRDFTPGAGLAACRTGQLMTVCGALPAAAPASLAEVGELPSQ